MSALSSESGSDTTLEPQEHVMVPPMAGSKRKSVIDTRRAEQNRAAQRAFRQRKEVYVRDLEKQVRDMEILKDRLERLEMENERLKYRVWELESSPTATATATATTTAAAATVTTPSASNSSNMVSTLTSSSSYQKTHSYGNDTTCITGDSQQRQQQHNHWSPISITDTTTKGIKSTNTTRTTFPSSSPSLSPPSSQHTTGSTPSMTHHILPPPSPSPSVFRPIPVAYWDKETTTNKRHRSAANDCHQQHQHQQHYSSQQSQPLDKDDTTPVEHGQVLDDLASILRTHHRPPIQNHHYHRHHQKEQQSQQRQEQPEPELMHT